MAKEITIKKKQNRKGDDGYKIVSVRMKEEMIEQLETLSSQTNRSRNELINMLLESALELVKVEDQKSKAPNTLLTACFGVFQLYEKIVQQKIGTTYWDK